MTTAEQKELDKIEMRISISKWLGFITVAIAIVLALLPFRFCSGLKYNEFGDYVGGVSGTMLSIGAMAFLYMTFQIQRKQILIQQSEINSDKLEREAGKLEVKKAKLEDWFLTLMQLHVDMVKSLDVRRKETFEVIGTGRDCFATYYNELDRAANGNLIDALAENNAKPTGDGGLRKKINFNDEFVAETLRSDLFKTYPDLEVYFNSIGSLLQHISKMQTEVKIDTSEYVNTVRSLLSQKELLIIYYFTLIEDEYLNELLKSNKRQIKTHGLTLFLNTDLLIKMTIFQIPGRK